MDASDADASCTGNANEPTAPPGKVCLYLASNYEGNALTAQGTALANTSGTRGFTVLAAPNAAPGPVDVAGVWAYTAP